MKRVIPVGDNLLIKPIKEEKENVSKGGIILTHKEDDVITNKAVVLEIGEGRLLQNGKYAPLNFEKGDKVIFNSFAGVEVDHDGDILLIIKANDIIAKIK